MRKTIYSRESRLVSELIREVREARGLTQTQLAERLGMRQNDISKTELGARRIDYVELRHLLRALDFDVTSFELLFQERLPLLPGIRQPNSSW